MEINLNTSDLGTIIHALSLHRELLLKRRKQGWSVFVDNIDRISSELRRAAAYETANEKHPLPISGKS